MSQVANTFWDNRLDSATRQNSVAKRKIRVRRLVDGVILTIILAALATCVSVHNRSRIEMAAARAKHNAAVDRIEDLSVQVEKRQREIESLEQILVRGVICSEVRMSARDIVIQLAQEKPVEPTTKEVESHLNPAQNRLYCRSNDHYIERVDCRLSVRPSLSTLEPLM